MLRFFALLALIAACARTESATSPSLANSRPVPAKCTACHLAPKQHSLAADRWERFQKHHRRRVRMTVEEMAVLHDFLVGGDRPKEVPRDAQP
jgi:hypothetical protein